MAPISRPPLQGAHIALISDARAQSAAHVVMEAARALGARTAQLRPMPDAAISEIRMLARLYRAIACEGLSHQQMAELEQAELPLCKGLASADHPDRLLADVMAIQAGAGGPAAVLTLVIVALDESPTVQAWQQASAWSGLQLRVLSPEEMTPEDVTREALRLNADALSDPRLPTCADGRQQIWLRRPGAPHYLSLAVEQARCHQQLVQTLLLRQLG